MSVKKRRLRGYVCFFLFILYLSHQPINISSLIYASSMTEFSFNQDELNEIENMIKNCGSGVSVYYQDIVSEYTYTYNSEQKYFIASLIKAPYCMYIYQLTSEEKCDLDKQYKYDSRHKASGTGKIQYMKIGTMFSMRELLQYAIKYSDNVAMNMIKEAFPVSGYKEYARSLGLTYLNDVKEATNGVITAKDAGVYIGAIYKFIRENEYGSELKTLMSSTSNAMIVSEYPVIRKYGWAEQSFHDIAIIDAPRPYLLCILTNHDGDFNSFKNISKVIERYSQKVDYEIANKSSYRIMFRGSELSIPIYEVDGQTYVSIKKMENVLKGTDIAIQIEWKVDKKAIYIQKVDGETEIQNIEVSNEEELQVQEKVDAVKEDYKIFWEGVGTFIDVYQIDGYTSIKLRDISNALGLKVKFSQDEGLIEVYD